MSKKITISSNDVKPLQISVAKKHEIWLNSDQFSP
jgi:hypothetical protein